MSDVAAAGSSIVIKGELSAREDMVIAGRVEGLISMEGHRLLVDTGGQVAAAVIARNVVIAGAVTGGVVAGERIELRSTARVKGELSAPRIAMADGATLNGRVDTSTRAPSQLRAVS